MSIDLEIKRTMWILKKRKAKWILNAFGAALGTLQDLKRMGRA